MSVSVRVTTEAGREIDGDIGSSMNMYPGDSILINMVGDRSDLMIAAVIDEEGVIDLRVINGEDIEYEFNEEADDDDHE